MGGGIVIDDSTLDKWHAQQIEMVTHYWSGNHHKVVSPKSSCSTVGMSVWSISNWIGLDLPHSVKNIAKSASLTARHCPWKRKPFPQTERSSGFPSMAKSKCFDSRPKRHGDTLGDQCFGNGTDCPPAVCGVVVVSSKFRGVDRWQYRSARPNAITLVVRSERLFVWNITASKRASVGSPQPVRSSENRCDSIQNDCSANYRKYQLNNS